MNTTKRYGCRFVGLLLLALLAIALVNKFAPSASVTGIELAAAPPSSYSFPGASGSFEVSGPLDSGQELGPGELDLEAGRPSLPPGPDYSKSLKQRSPHDPDVFRTDNTNRRDDNANNSPNK